MIINKNGKEAKTYFKVLVNGPVSLVDVTLLTGRTHQIRVHLSEIGYPIVGDEVYSNGKNPFGVKGQMLHAEKLELKHPRTGKDLTFEAPVPKYFANIINQLEKE